MVYNFLYVSLIWYTILKYSFLELRITPGCIVTTMRISEIYVLTELWWPLVYLSSEKCTAWSALTDPCGDSSDYTLEECMTELGIIAIPIRWCKISQTISSCRDIRSDTDIAPSPIKPNLDFKFGKASIESRHACSITATHHTHRLEPKTDEAIRSHGTDMWNHVQK